MTKQRVDSLSTGSVTNSSALIGVSDQIRQVRQAVQEAASNQMNVLIQGESGTGKDVVAQLIHQHSNRAKSGEFVKLNCPSIPESLLESELFGHESGAFTGADKTKVGWLEVSNNGTLFLDEIGDIPTYIQAKLLQFIEQKKFSRVGGVKMITVDTRILAATNAPLKQMIQSQAFRADLYYRLNELSITLPPLRERSMDIPVLVENFIENFGRLYQLETHPVSKDLMEAMTHYLWPGNIRELKTIIKRYVFSQNEQTVWTALEADERSLGIGAPETLPTSEKNLIVSALVKACGNQRKAASMLGISYSALRRRIEKYNLKNDVYFSKVI